MLLWSYSFSFFNSQVHFFNSFFYDKLRTKGYDGVKRWTKNVSISGVVGFGLLCSSCLYIAKKTFFINRRPVVDSLSLAVYFNLTYLIILYSFCRTI